jgi:glycosyltransferase involved in cell wall biosynthesis
MMVAYASGRNDVEFIVVNTAPKWRSIYNNGILLRAFGGSSQLLWFVVRLVRVLSGHQIDTLHLTTSGQLGAARDLVVSYVARIFNIGFVYHIHFGRIPEVIKANSLEWWIIHRVMRRASSVILIDKASYAAVKKFAPDTRAVLIPNCVNVAALPPRVEIANEVKTALFVGWVIPTKGIAELVEAWSILRPLGWRLEIVGPGDPKYQAELLQKFEPEHLEFVGELSHAKAMARMASCDLFVLPSYTEGFPNVVVEAMALGCPIVATEVGAIPEMLEGNAGVLVKSRDSEALAKALGKLIVDAELRARLGQQAFAKAMHLYTIDIIFRNCMQIWRAASGFI